HARRGELVGADTGRRVRARHDPGHHRRAAHRPLRLRGTPRRAPPRPRRTLIAALMVLGACGPVVPPPPTDLPPITIHAQLPAPPPSSTIAPAVASRPAVRLMIFEQETPTLPPPVEVFAPAGLDR